MLFASVAYAGGGPRNVVVVRNLDSPESRQIASYYVAARQIPSSNVCDLRTPTSEIISKADFATKIITPLKTFLSKPELHDHIDYIVLTKGIPLGVDYSSTTQGPLSTASVISCIDDPTIVQLIRNPYGPTVSAPLETAFSHQLTFNDRLYKLINFHMYLVTRLDGYTVDDVKRMIDGGLANASPTASFLIDSMPGLSAGYLTWDNRLITANSILVARGIPTIFDSTSAFLTDRSNLMGYFGWGSHDGNYTLEGYLSNKFAPGSIADTAVSSDGRTFNQPTDRSGQSLIADLISSGACGVCGYVSEPQIGFCNWPSTLVDRYTKGYNLAESFYMACPVLFWKAAIVGDPLMAPYAVHPEVSVVAPSEALTGTAAAITATATHPRGISHVDFLLDDEYIGTATSEPFSITFDSTQYLVGEHEITAIAYENSPVATQGQASATVDIHNPISMLRHLSDAFRSPDGQGVLFSGAVVTAGTEEMGGGEFYVSEPSRAAALRIISNVPTFEGDLVIVQGTMTTQSGQRAVIAEDVQPMGKVEQLLRPVAMQMAVVGGGDWSQCTKGVTGGRGLFNLGMLIRVAGRVTYVGGDGEPFFYVADGCRLVDSSGRSGLRIDSRDLFKPSLGSFVSITGISSCTESGGVIDRCVKPRHAADIAVLYTGS